MPGEQKVALGVRVTEIGTLAGRCPEHCKGPGAAWDTAAGVREGWCRKGIIYVYLFFMEELTVRRPFGNCSRVWAAVYHHQPDLLLILRYDCWNALLDCGPPSDFAGSS